MQIRQLKGQKQEDYLQMIAMEITSSLEMMLGLDHVIGDKGTILHILNTTNWIFWWSRYRVK